MDITTSGFGEPTKHEKLVDTGLFEKKGAKKGKKKKQQNNDDDDDDDDNKEEKRGPSKDALEFVDCIGDIEAKLKKNTLSYVYGKNVADFEEQKTRVFGEIYEKLKNKLTKDTYNYPSSIYPHQSRFITFIDRRKSSTKQCEYDDKLSCDTSKCCTRMVYKFKQNVFITKYGLWRW